MMVSLRAGEGSSRGMPPSTALAIRTRGPQGDSANTNKSDQREVQVNKKKRVVRAWEQYMIDDTLAENWARFLHDLGLGDFKSKSQCKKALKGIWINIHDFLDAVKQRNAAAQTITDERAREAALTGPVKVKFFKSQGALARYTLSSHRVFPRKHIANGSPLKLLLANILNPRGG